MSIELSLRLKLSVSVKTISPIVPIMYHKYLALPFHGQCQQLQYLYIHMTECINCNNVKVFHVADIHSLK